MTSQILHEQLPGTVAAHNTDAYELGTQMFRQLHHLVEAGGPVVVILLLLSTIALAVVLLKWWQFSQLRVESLSAVNEALTSWREHDSAAAIERTMGRLDDDERAKVLGLNAARIFGFEIPARYRRPVAGA